MEQLSERLQTPISTAELERRWAAVRAAMERDKIDVLLMQNNSDQMGGYVKYFTDLPATNGYPLTVVFPRDDLMTLVSQGPFGGVNALDVFNEEPLPKDHPFWAMENVIITTHQGGFCDVYIDYALPTVEANMECFLKGDFNGMINVVAH